MSMIDPMTGLRTPVRLTPIGQGQASLFSNLFQSAGTPMFEAAPTISRTLVGSAIPSTGPTGLGGLTGAALNGTRLPFMLSSPVGGLLTGPAAPGGLPRLGLTAGQNLMGSLRPLTTSVASQAADTGLAAQLGNAAGSGGTRGMLGAFGRGLGLARPSMLKGGLYGIGGSIGSSLVDRADLGGKNSILDQFATGATFGGIGGAAFGPMGAAIGAPAGGALNVLGNALGIFGGGEGGEEEKADPVSVLATAIQTAGLSPDATEDILTQYDTMIALAEQQPDDETREAARQAAFDQTAQLILATMQQEQQQEQAVGDLSGTSMLALQAQAGQIFNPIADDIRQSAMLYADSMNQIRDQLPESYRAVADATVSRELSSADRLANAYLAQAALTPVADRLTRYQQERDAFANQQYQQMLAQQAAGTSAGTDVLAALAG